MKVSKKFIASLIISTLLASLTSAENKEFPTGKWVCESFKLEVKGGPTIDSSQMDFYELTADVSKVGNLVTMHVKAQIRMHAGNPTQKDERLDKYVLSWTNDHSGKLKNQNPMYPSGDFSIEGDTITMKGFLPQHNAWETKVFKVKE